MKSNPQLAAVVLAAGPSSRLGQAKQLVRLGNESLVRRSARMLTELENVSVSVVTGCDSIVIANEVDDLPVKVLFNTQWPVGMGSSIASGARNIDMAPDGILVMACDQWRLETADLHGLISAWLTDISRIYLAEWKEGGAFVSGPPVIFPRALLPDLKAVIPSRGARQVIDKNMEIVEYVTMANAGFDLDRPEDLELLNQSQLAVPQ